MRRLATTTVITTWYFQNWNIIQWLSLSLSTHFCSLIRFNSSLFVLFYIHSQSYLITQVLSCDIFLNVSRPLSTLSRRKSLKIRQPDPQWGSPFSPRSPVLLIHLSNKLIQVYSHMMSTMKVLLFHYPLPVWAAALPLRDFYSFPVSFTLIEENNFDSSLWYTSTWKTHLALNTLLI